MKNFKFTLLISLFVLFGFANADEKPIIAVTIVPEVTFVQKVVGDDFNIIASIPPGASPETYEPSPMDKENLNDAILYFAIGIQNEETQILPFLNPNTKLVKLNESVSATYEDCTLGTERDPHIWLSPKRVQVMVHSIAEVLAKAYPEKSEIYKNNAQAYISELEEVDKQIKENLSNIKSNKFISFHPAFQYFASDYGLEMHAIEEHGKEATAHRLQDIIDLSKENNIKVLFLQNEISSRQAEAFVNEIGGKVIVLTPLSAEYIENLLSTAKHMAEVLK